jgi:hypothetical protein
MTFKFNTSIVFTWSSRFLPTCINRILAEKIGKKMINITLS